MYKIGILRERKVPADKRVALNPDQCMQLIQQYPKINLVVERSPIRCFSDSQYQDLGIKLVDDVSDCDILFGVKEVPIKNLIANKTYFYFSHTIKKQPYNKKLLSTMLEKNIRMVDYETLCDSKNKRLIGFGKYAGIVGCYNGFLTYGLRTKKYSLKPANQCFDRKELDQELKKVKVDNVKIILTGSGRVGEGALEILHLLGIKQVDTRSFLNDSFDYPVFVVLNVLDYNQRSDNKESSKVDFYANPGQYKSIFNKFAAVADIFIAGHFFGNGSPYLFTREDAKKENFKIRTVADISCDIDGPVACTIRPSTIEEPIYGYNPIKEEEDLFDKENVISVMAVDNLPCELPRDASSYFGNVLIQSIFPALLDGDEDTIIERATICKDGKLTSNFQYLHPFVFGN
jgi:alanine dehydrogenase